jgi:hypothetical protein
MNFDLFEKLAEKDVPPVPVDFDRQVHARVNDSLLGVHVTEFLFQVVPYGLWHFAQATIGLFVLTLSGRFPHDRGDRPKHR